MIDSRIHRRKESSEFINHHSVADPRVLVVKKASWWHFRGLSFVHPWTTRSHHALLCSLKEDMHKTLGLQFAHGYHSKRPETSPLVQESRIQIMSLLQDQLQTMVAQECAVYRTVDYLAPGYQQSLAQNGSDDPQILLDLAEESSTSTGGSSTGGITEAWREKICEWAYQVS